MLGNSPFCIDLFIILQTGTAISWHTCFKNDGLIPSCPWLFFAFRDFIIFSISLGSVGLMYIDDGFLWVFLVRWV